MKKQPTHVDDFIDHGTSLFEPQPNEEYARYVLHHFRLPATLQIAFKDFTRLNELYCTYEGNLYRVAGASSLGDVWLHSELLSYNAKAHYEKRVNIDELSGWTR